MIIHDRATRKACFPFQAPQQCLRNFLKVPFSAPLIIPEIGRDCKSRRGRVIYGTLQV